MKTDKKKNILFILLAAVLGLVPIVSGCGGGGGGGAVSVSGTDSSLVSDVPGAPSQSDTEFTSGTMPDGTPIVEEYPGELRQLLRVVGDPGCSVTRTFSKSRILPATSATVTITVSGCTTALESLYYGSVIPSDLILNTVSVKVNGADIPYVYEAPTATSTYHHWVTDDVPVDGVAEMPAGGIFQLVYRVTDDGLHPDNYVYEFTGFRWSAHDPASSNNIWGYSNSGFNLTVGIPPLGASGGPNINSFYNPDNAFDGNYRTWWAGELNYGRWELFYRFPAMQHMDDLFINFYSNSHLPTTVNIYHSNDGINWTLAGTMPAGNSKPNINLNANLTYIWIEMIGTPAIGFPLIRDVDWLPVTESKASTGGLGFGPSSDPNFYVPSNAFDFNLTTLWAGFLNNVTWDLYYHFPDPQQIVGPVQIYYHSSNHKPTTTTVEYSSDGAAWTSAGASTGAGATQTVTVARKTAYIHVSMVGNPLAGAPIIRDVDWAVPVGPSGGVNANLFNTPDKAFDADVNSQWAGRANDGIWYLFYGYAAPHFFTNVKMWFMSLNHAPTAGVNVYFSSDGKTWTLHGAMPAYVLDPIGVHAAARSTTYAMNLSAKYICFEMIGTPPSTFVDVLNTQL